MRHSVLFAFVTAAVAMGCGAKVHEGDIGATGGAGGTVDASDEPTVVGAPDAPSDGTDASDGRADVADQDASVVTPPCVERSERYEPGHAFTYVGGEREQFLPDCTPTCGSVRHDVWYSTDALPAGACDPTSPACGMPAWHLCACLSPGSLDGYKCSCVDGRWSCVIIGARGLGICNCAGTDADADGDARDASPPCPGIAGHPKADCQYPTYPGFTLALVEEFDEPLDLATDPIWTHSDGHTDGMYTRFDKASITFTGGNAVLTATKPDGGVPASRSYAEGDDNTGNWPINVASATVQSGELRTKHNNWRYGRFEARYKAALNVNVISSFFTFRNPKWQDWRELVFSVTPANDANRCETNIVHGTGAFAYSATQNLYIAAVVPSVSAGATLFDDFHTYAFENMPSSVKWYADGALVRTETGSSVRLMDKAMKIMFNLWVFSGSDWGGGMPTMNTYPMSMLIDWVRLYKSDADTVYPCSPLPECQPAEDRDYQKNNAEDGLPSAAPW
jgi:beta-glucanase (GH16 family)